MTDAPQTLAITFSLDAIREEITRAITPAVLSKHGGFLQGAAIRETKRFISDGGFDAVIRSVIEEVIRKDADGVIREAVRVGVKSAVKKKAGRIIAQSCSGKSVEQWVSDAIAAQIAAQLSEKK